MSCCDLVAQLGLPSPCADFYEALLTIIRNTFVAGGGIVLTREGGKVVISLIDPLILAGDGIAVVQNPDGTYTISSTATPLVFDDTDTIEVSGDGSVGTPYIFDLAPGALVAGPGIAVAQAPNGVFTISSTVLPLQFWTEQFDPVRPLTSWNAVNASVAGFRNITGFTINRRTLNNPGDPFGVDAVDLHQSNVFGFTAAGANSGLFVGTNNRVTAPRACVVCGTTNNVVTAAANSCVVSGSNNVIFAVDSFIGGGTGNLVQSALSTRCSIVGGSSNLASGTENIIVGGSLNTCAGTRNLIATGLSNASEAGWINCFIGGGLGGGAALPGDIATNSMIGAGSTNTLGNLSSNSAIVAGNLNLVTGTNNGILTGTGNAITAGANSTVLGGSTNTVTTPNGFSSVVAGEGNNVGGTATRSAVLCGLGNAVNGAAANSSVLSGNGVTINVSDTHNLDATPQEAVVPASNSCAGGRQVFMQASHSFAMGHSLSVLGAHGSFTTGSYLTNTKPHSTLLGRHGYSSALFEGASLEVCDGSLDDERAVFLTGRDRAGHGVVCSDSMRMTSSTASCLFPKGSNTDFRLNDDVGFFVSLESDGSVSPALDGSNVLGVTVPRSGMILNSYDQYWHKKYVKDDFDRLLTRASYVDSFLDLLSHLELNRPETSTGSVDDVIDHTMDHTTLSLLSRQKGGAVRESNKKEHEAAVARMSLFRSTMKDLCASHDEGDLIDYAVQQHGEEWPELRALTGRSLVARQVPILSPTYDKKVAYVPRVERKEEWVPVVQRGIVRVRCAEGCIVGSYCAIKDGIAVPISARGNYKILGRVSSSVITIML